MMQLELPGYFLQTDGFLTTKQHHQKNLPTNCVECGSFELYIFFHYRYRRVLKFEFSMLEKKLIHYKTFIQNQVLEFRIKLNIFIIRIPLFNA